MVRALAVLALAIFLLVGCDHPSYSDGLRSATHAMEDACVTRVAVLVNELSYFEAFPTEWEKHYREVMANARRVSSGCDDEMDHQRWRAANYERGDGVGSERLPR